MTRGGYYSGNNAKTDEWTKGLKDLQNLKDEGTYQRVKGIYTEGQRDIYGGSREHIRMVKGTYGRTEGPTEGSNNDGTFGRRTAALWGKRRDKRQDVVT